MNISIHRIVGLMSLVFVLGACMPQTNDKGQAMAKPFFDLKGFIADEVSRLEATNPTVRKIAFLDNEKEEAVRDSIQWEEEFSLFAKSDINKTAWLDRYNVDSVFDAQTKTLSSVEYEALDSELYTQYLRVDFDASGAVTRIRIKKHRSSEINTGASTLDYIVGKSYTFERVQDVRFQPQHVFRVQATFES